MKFNGFNLSLAGTSIVCLVYEVLIGGPGAAGFQVLIGVQIGLALASAFSTVWLQPKPRAER